MKHIENKYKSLYDDNSDYDDWLWWLIMMADYDDWLWYMILNLKESTDFAKNTPQTIIMVWFFEGFQA